MSIFDKYDLVDVNESIDCVKIPKHGVTLIVGSSGSGKTTILKNEFGSIDHYFDTETPIYQLFESEEAAEKFLITAGLRSVPAWKRTLSTVSNGERHRAEMALSMANGFEFIDEFTSVVDRDTARALCHCVNQSKPNRLVIATCHRDVIDWLDADYIYDTDTKSWIDRGLVRRDRELHIEIKPCDTKEVWEIFRKHHYLSGQINKSANSWVALYNGNPVAMASIISFPSGNWSDGWRGHRTVVLPEFQGMGIGSALSDTIAGWVISTGSRYFSKTAHPAMGIHRNNSPKWKPTSKNGVVRKDYKSGRKTKEDGHKFSHAHRVCYSHEYIG